MDNKLGFKMKGDLMGNVAALNELMSVQKHFENQISGATTVPLFIPKYDALLESITIYCTNESHSANTNYLTVDVQNGSNSVLNSVYNLNDNNSWANNKVVELKVTQNELLEKNSVLNLVIGAQGTGGTLDNFFVVVNYRVPMTQYS